MMELKEAIEILKKMSNGSCFITLEEEINGFNSAIQEMKERVG